MIRIVNQTKIYFLGSPLDQDGLVDNIEQLSDLSLQVEGRYEMNMVAICLCDEHVRH